MRFSVPLSQRAYRLWRLTSLFGRVDMNSALQSAHGGCAKYGRTFRRTQWLRWRLRGGTRIHLHINAALSAACWVAFAYNRRPYHRYRLHIKLAWTWYNLVPRIVLGDR
jgi:hypothetical protein